MLNNICFVDRLNRLAAERSYFCLGVDPSTDILARWGYPDNVTGLTGFCAHLTELIGDQLALIKPQIAFFERFGAEGLAILHGFMREMSQTGTLTILDAKRGDIASSNAAYAESFFGRNGYRADAVTVSPFLGFSALEPIIRAAEQNAGMVFVVVASSNPEGSTLQNATTDAGSTISAMLATQIAERNKQSEKILCGAVIGATREDMVPQLVSSLEGAPILAPGIGKQGGDIEMLSKYHSGLLIPTAARSILECGPQKSFFQDKLAEYKQL